MTDVHAPGPAGKLSVSARPTLTVPSVAMVVELRGFPDLVRARGAVEAAEALFRFRALVQQAADRYPGIEVTAEGDSFNLECASVVAAVECAQFIVAGATLRDGSGELTVACGIGAGNPADSAEALFRASELAAAAAPREILVDDSVRAQATGASSSQFALYRVGLVRPSA